MWSNIQKFINTSFFGNKKTPLQRYALPIIFALVIVMERTVLQSDLGNRLSFHLLLFAVVVSAWFGGLGPGLLATAIFGFLSDVLFHNPTVAFFSRDRFVVLLIFIVEGVLVSIIAETKKQADKQRDDFISITGHELKNPLTALNGYLYILQKEAQKNATSRMSSVVESAKDEVQKITGLVNDLLDVSRIESGKLLYKDEIFPIREWLESVIAEQQMVSMTHKIILHGKSKHSMKADKHRLSQVMINLLTNAMKYSPKSKKVMISVEDHSRKTVIKIRDYGVGIPKESLNKIFNRFYRAGNSGSAQGLGLGLFISSQIVNHYNGKISVKSTKGKGSTFFIELPSKPKMS